MRLDLENAPPGVGVLFEDAPSAGDAGSIHHHIDRTTAGADLLERSCQIIGGGDIALDDTFCPHPVEADHPVAGFSKRQHHRGADCSGAAADDDGAGHGLATLGVSGSASHSSQWTDTRGVRRASMSASLERRLNRP